MPFSIWFIDSVEPEKVMHDKVTAEDSGFRMFTRLLVEPQSNHRVGEPMREEQMIGRETVPDDGFSRGCVGSEDDKWGFKRRWDSILLIMYDPIPIFFHTLHAGLEADLASEFFYLR